MKNSNKIPKVMFFYWGNDKMSWMRYLSLYSFRKFNPDWKIKLFVSKQELDKKLWLNNVGQDFFNYDGDDYTDKIKELNVEIIEWDINKNKINNDINIGKVSSSHKSNFLKWSKLYEDGGFYSDLDILYFKSIDNLYNKLINDNYDGMLCQTGHLSIGFMSSKKGNYFFKDVFNSALKTYHNYNYQSAGVVSVYNLLNTLKNTKTTMDVLNKKYKDLNFYNLPFHVVYPFISGDLNISISNIMKINYDNKIINNIKDDTIGFHWYAGHPSSQKLNNLLNNNNYNDYNNIITDLINKYNII